VAIAAAAALLCHRQSWRRASRL